MKASKENAIAAEQKLTQVSDSMTQEHRNSYSRHLCFLHDFIDACKRKLPSEAAYQKDKARK